MGCSSDFLKLSLLAALILVGVAAGAQEVRRGQTVENRPRPKFDPPGIRLGAFELFPELALEGLVHSNIFADRDDVVDDFILSAKPGILLESDWGNHALSLGTEMDIARYQDNDAEDFEDFWVFAEGRLDITRFSHLAGAVSYSQEHEDRASPDDAEGINPTEFSVNRAAMTYIRRPNRTYLELNGIFRELNFEDTLTSAGIVDNDDRSRQQLKGTMRLGYQISPSYSIFLQGEVNEWDYEQQFDNDGFQRSSDGYEAVVGASLDFSGQTFGDIFVGFRSQEFDDARFNTVDGVSFGGDITWNVTQLTTLNFLASRTIEPTTIVGASGYRETRFAVAAAHELLRSLIVTANVATVTQDFQGIDREDDVADWGIGMKYMLNRKLYLFAGYDSEHRDSQTATGGGTEYRIEKFFIRVQGQL